MGDMVTITSLKTNETTQKIAVRYKVPKVSDLVGPSATVSQVRIYYNIDAPVSISGSDYVDYADVISEYTPGKRSKHTFTGLARDHQYFFLLHVVCYDEDDPDHSVPIVFEDADDVWLTRIHGRYMVKIEDPTLSSPDDPWIDITPYIEGMTYEVNNETVFDTWEDANYTTHYEVDRTRINGSFKVLLYTREIYNIFVDLIQKNMTSNTSGGKKAGLVHMKVQVNNELDPDSAETLRTKLPELYKGWFKVEYKPVWNIPFLGIKEVDSIEVKIEEE